MTDIYIDCTVSNGVGSEIGLGTQNDPYTTLSAAYSASVSLDVLNIKTDASNMYIPTNQVLDSKGLIFKTWLSDYIYTDCVNLTDVYAIYLNHVSSSATFFNIKNVPAGKTGFRIVKVLADEAFADNFIHDSDGSACLVSGSLINGLLRLRRNRFSRVYRSWRFDTTDLGNLIEIYDHIDTDINLYCDINDVANITTYRYLSAGGQQEAFNVAETASIEHIDPIFLGSCVLADRNPRELIVTTGSSDSLITDGLITVPVFDTAPFTDGLKNDGTGANVASGTKGFAGESAKLFATPRRGGMACFIRDDLEDYVTDGLYPTEAFPWLDALESRGLVGTYAINTMQNHDTNDISVAGWDDIRSVAARGHELSTHGRIAQDLYPTHILDLNYTGVDTTVNVVISGGYLNTYHNGSGTATISYQLNTLSTGLLDAINAISGYTATYAPTVNQFACETLADVNIANIKNNLTELSVDVQRLYDFEIDGCRQDIIDQTGYTPTTHVYSTGSGSNTIAAMMLADGYVGARTGLNISVGVNDHAYMYPFHDPDYNTGLMAGVITSNFIDRTSDATITRSVQAICHWADWWGAPIVFYDHEFTTFSLHEWEVLFDAVISTGISTGDYKSVSQWAIDKKTSQLPLADQQLLDDSWNPILDSDSAYIDWVYGTGGASSGLYLEIAPSIYVDL